MDPNWISEVLLSDLQQLGGIGGESWDQMLGEGRIYVREGDRHRPDRPRRPAPLYEVWMVDDRGLPHLVPLTTDGYEGWFPKVEPIPAGVNGSSARASNDRHDLHLTPTRSAGSPRRRRRRRLNPDRSSGRSRPMSTPRSPGVRGSILRESATAAIAEMAVDAYIAASRHDTSRRTRAIPCSRNERVGSNTGLPETPLPLAQPRRDDLAPAGALIASASARRCSKRHPLGRPRRHRPRADSGPGRPADGVDPRCPWPGGGVGGAGAQERVVLHQGRPYPHAGRERHGDRRDRRAGAPFAMRGTADRARSESRIFYRGVEGRRQRAGLRGSRRRGDPGVDP